MQLKVIKSIYKLAQHGPEGGGRQKAPGKTEPEVWGWARGPERRWASGQDRRTHTQLRDKAEG